MVMFHCYGHGSLPEGNGWSYPSHPSTKVFRRCFAPRQWWVQKDQQDGLINNWWGWWGFSWGSNRFRSHFPCPCVFQEYLSVHSRNRKLLITHTLHVAHISLLKCHSHLLRGMHRKYLGIFESYLYPLVMTDSLPLKMAITIEIVSCSKKKRLVDFSIVM